MAHKKPLSFRPTEKNIVYLQYLGFIDGRSGGAKSRGSAESFGKFVNECITFILENGMTGYQASREEILHAYWSQRCKMIGRAYADLNEELAFAQNKRAQAENLLLEKKPSKNI